jgi:NTE family protein
MAADTFSSVLQEPGLRLTAEEKAEILRRMPPPDAEDGSIYVDGVFEGGGMRGLAFLGALRCMDDLGLRWRKLAGTSAGAITASLLAADFPVDQLEIVMGAIDFRQFTKQKTSRWILDNDPSDDLRSPFKMLLLLAIARKLGQYSAEPFRKWLGQDVLSARHVKTFGDVRALHPERELKVVASDITRGQMLVLPDDLDVINQGDGERSLKQALSLAHSDQFSVAEAVRLSMSIPLFFEPGDLDGRKIVDGGILSNFPLWIYDFNPLREPEQKCPRWPTFGFRLVETPGQAKPIKGPLGLLLRMFRTMMVARDQYHLSQSKKDRVIEIDVTAAGASVTEFNLSDQKKADLYRLGYQKTKEFLLKSWDWERHLRDRGYNPQDLVL